MTPQRTFVGALALDTSAVAAVIFGESDAELLTGAMVDHAGDLHISAATLVESAIVVEAKQGAAAGDDFRALLDTLAVNVVPVDADQALLAVTAWQRFGKGRHRAALNLGDCFAYALAKQLGCPLLYKGGDFGQTDIATL